MARTRTPTRAEPKTRKRKADDAAQYERFREFAKTHETDENPETFDRRFMDLVRQPKVPQREQD
jgi:hypothetical protein